MNKSREEKMKTLWKEIDYVFMFADKWEKILGNLQLQSCSIMQIRLLWDQNVQHWNMQNKKIVFNKFYEIQIPLCRQNVQLKRSMFMYVFLLLNGNTHLFLYRFYTCMLLFIIIVCIFFILLNMCLVHDYLLPVWLIKYHELTENKCDSKALHSSFLSL